MGDEEANKKLAKVRVGLRILFFNFVFAVWHCSLGAVAIGLPQYEQRPKRYAALGSFYVRA